MCGIGGFYDLRHGEHALELFKSIADRGMHASGFAVWSQEYDYPLVMKRPYSSRQWAREMVFPFNRPSKVLLLHTRYATQGDKQNLDNNHPILYGNTILTHNGVLQNDDEVFRLLNCKRHAQVDSEALAAAIELKGIQWAVDHCRGSMSIAWIDKTKPNTLNLFTNGLNPLVLGVYGEETIVYASQPHHLDSINADIEWWHAQVGVHYEITDGKVFMHYLKGTWRDPMTYKNTVY